MNHIEQPKSVSFLEPIRLLRWLLVFVLAIPVVPLLASLNNKPILAGLLVIFVGIIFLRYRNSFLSTLRTVDPWAWILIVITIASVSWASEPVIASKRAFAEVMLPLVAVAMLARGYSSSWLSTNLRIGATVLLLLSFFVCLVVPEIGVISYFGQGERWIGVMNSKNQLGRLTLLCVVCWAFVVKQDGTYPMTFRLAVAAISFITLYFTDNATSIAVMALVLLFFIIATTSKGIWRVVWVFTFGATLILLGYVVAIVYGIPTTYEILEALTSLVNRDSGLTGRADLWHYTWGEIAKNPLLGKGFGVAWLTNHESVQGITSYINDNSWQPTQAHNSFIDIILKTGYLGFTAWVMLLISHMYRLFTLHRLIPDIVNLHVALLICIFACSLFSSIFYRGFSGPWGIIIWVSIIEISYLSYVYRAQLTSLQPEQTAKA